LDEKTEKKDLFQEGAVSALNHCYPWRDLGKRRGKEEEGSDEREELNSV